MRGKRSPVTPSHARQDLPEARNPRTTPRKSPPNPHATPTIKGAGSNTNPRSKTDNSSRMTAVA